MRGSAVLATAIAVWTGCSTPQKPAPGAAAKQDPVHITQFYTSLPKISRGEKSLICYGVENAKLVWLSPPRQELSASPAQCVEVTPAQTTTYTLTAEGDGNQHVSQDLTVTVGAPKVKIIEVRVNSLAIKPGEPVSICYQVKNAKSVRIQPIDRNDRMAAFGCALDSPTQTKTYVVTARGAEGDKDEERITVKVH